MFVYLAQAGGLTSLSNNATLTYCFGHSMGRQLCILNMAVQPRSGIFNTVEKIIRIIISKQVGNWYADVFTLVI